MDAGAEFLPVVKTGTHHPDLFFLPWEWSNVRFVSRRCQKSMRIHRIKYVLPEHLGSGENIFVC